MYFAGLVPLDSGMQGIEHAVIARKKRRNRALGVRAQSTQVALRACLAFGCLLLLAAALLRIRDDSQLAEAEHQGLTIVMRAAPNLGDSGQLGLIARRLAASGVTHVLLQFKQDESDEFQGGEVFFPSKIAPVAQGFEDDRIGRLLEALCDRGIQVRAWIPTLHDPAAAILHPEWRAWWLPADGGPEDQQSWLCPSSSDAVAYEASIAAEVMQRYPLLAGLYIDFIRYDSDHSCVCDRCLTQLDERVEWTEQQGRAITAEDVRQAGAGGSSLWNEWVSMRAERVCDAVDAIRDRVEEVRPDCPIGACVLPFSAADYSFNTQSGQDLYEMARAGLDEIVLMGYWDDWNKNPQWLARCIDEAGRLVEGECALSCLIDADMAPRRTRLTLDAVAKSESSLREGFLGFFQYQSWDDSTLAHVRQAMDNHKREGETPKPDHTNVVIRIDTEPDSERSYQNVHPEMIRTVMECLESEGVRGTFMTCGRLAELQPEVIREAAARGHEIGNHAYDHEQLDALTEAEQIAIIDRSVEAFRVLGVACVGFGAPRNSVTSAVRDRLIHHGFRYDGSEAYDPMEALFDPQHVDEPEGQIRLLVIPFIWPNDWDARRILNCSAAEMLDMWKKRLDAVVEMGEPVFVLDVHQWLVSEPENLAALQSFVRYARAQPSVRTTTLAQAAIDIEDYLSQFEPDRDDRSGGNTP